MVKALFAVVSRLLGFIKRFRAAWLFEAAGAGLIAFALYDTWGVAASAAGAGVALLAKSAELEARGSQ